jgi:hypothetical protein
MHEILVRENGELFRFISENLTAGRRDIGTAAFQIIEKDEVAAIFGENPVPRFPRPQASLTAVVQLRHLAD